MIALTTLLLFVLGIFSSLRVSVRADKLLSLLIFIALSVVFAQFCRDMFDQTEHIYSFIWNSSPGGDIKIDIISNPYNYGLIFPFFAITVAASAQNLLFRYEERRGIYAAELIFNLIVLIMMITSNNFVQLLFALFVTDILVLFLIRDIEAYRRYILMNMAADFMIFMIFAVINSRVASLDIREILQYKQTGLHLDFIAIVGLTAVFIKLGLFLFHIGITGLKSVRLHRLQNILFLSTPVCGIILLLKFHVLWSASAYFVMYLHFFCILSMLGGFFISLLRDQIKEKVIGWQMMFWALFVELLHFNGFIWNEKFSALLLQMYVLMWGIYLTYYYTGRRQKISSLLNISFMNQRALCCSYTLILLMIAAMAGTLTSLYNKGNREDVWIFGILFVLSLSTTLKSIFFISKNKLQVQNVKIGNHYLCWLFIGCCAAVLLTKTDIFETSVWSFCLAFLILSLVSPLWRVSRFFSKQKYQQIDWVSKLYKYFLIKPLRLSGRVLWLLIDQFLIEKVVMGTSIAVAQYSLRFFRRLHSSKIVGGVVIVILLAGFLGLAYYRG